MGTALSQDIRDRFAALYAEGHSAREIGRRLMISAARGVDGFDHRLTPPTSRQTSARIGGAAMPPRSIRRRAGHHPTPHRYVWRYNRQFL